MNSFKRIRSKKRKKILLIALTFIAAFLIVVLLSIPIFVKKAETERKYEDLIILVEKEIYTKAYEKANEIIGSNYKDTTAILYLCNSHMLYEQGDIFGAYDEIDKVTFKYIEDEELAKIEEYKEMLRKECNKILENQGEISSEESEKSASRKKRESQKIKTEVRTAEEEFAYNDAEEMREESEITNNNKKADGENGNENS